MNERRACEMRNLRCCVLLRVSRRSGGLGVGVGAARGEWTPGKLPGTG